MAPSAPVTAALPFRRPLPMPVSSLHHFHSFFRGPTFVLLLVLLKPPHHRLCPRLPATSLHSKTFYGFDFLTVRIPERAWRLLSDGKYRGLAPLHPESCPVPEEPYLRMGVRRGRAPWLAPATCPSLLQRCSPIPRRRTGCLLPPIAMTTVSPGSPVPSWAGGPKAGRGVERWGDGAAHAPGMRPRTSLTSHCTSAELRTRCACLPSARRGVFPSLQRLGGLVGEARVSWRPSQPRTPALPALSTQGRSTSRCSSPRRPRPRSSSGPSTPWITGSGGTSRPTGGFSRCLR